MTTRNDITGDAIASRTTSDDYRNNFDAIFKMAKRLQPTNATLAKESERLRIANNVALGTPPAVREAMQRLTDLLQTEPGYSGWSRMKDCTGSCDRGEECRCKA